jgi:hypothetical protein
MPPYFSFLCVNMEATERKQKRAQVKNACGKLVDGLIDIMNSIDDSLQGSFSS